MKEFRISPSSIGLMLECERCFWLKLHGVWNRPSGPFPSLPSGMDSKIKDHFDRFRKKGILPPELRENGCVDGCELFVNDELMSKWRNNRQGIRWTDPSGNVFLGAIDDMLIHNGKLIVLDYKTRGWPPKGAMADYYQHQLDIYTYLLRKNGYETEDFAYLLIYYPRNITETGEVIFDTKLERVPVSVENAERLFRRALGILYSTCPSPSDDCEWCKLIKVDSQQTLT